jgi:hypothetical protein
MRQRMSMEEYRSLSNTDRRVERRPRKQEEHNHQAAFFSVIRMPANLKTCPALAFIFAPPNAAKRTAYERNMMLSEGLTAGVPDVIILCQRRGYPGAVMENKFGANTLTNAQKKFRDHLLSEGYCFKTLYSADQQLEFVEWYFGITLVK